MAMKRKEWVVGHRGPILGMLYGLEENISGFFTISYVEQMCTKLRQQAKIKFIPLWVSFHILLNTNT